MIRSGKAIHFHAGIIEPRRENILQEKKRKEGIPFPIGSAETESRGFLDFCGFLPVSTAKGGCIDQGTGRA